ncbi:hypothetical protein [Sphingomonas arenae]|uniref:hypothetical protein n=1 Tax=Sphingomonas arenae TaxID=2812555 RepID=UPI0019670B80|nr:hypothetical protein [Sphingomonas arenae]
MSMLLFGFLAGLQVAATQPSPAAVRAQSRVSIRIVRGASVKRGRSGEPHSSGKVSLTDVDGQRRTIPLVEFH